MFRACVGVFIIASVGVFIIHIKSKMKQIPWNQITLIVLNRQNIVAVEPECSKSNTARSKQVPSIVSVE